MSSLIDVASFSPVGNRLAVGLKGGDIYLYHDVPEHIADTFVTSPSLGQAFNRLIRGKYQFTRVERTEA